MKQKLRSRLLTICTALSCGCVMLLSGSVIDTESYAATDTGEVSVIFTHDMHSHMDADRVSKDGKVVEAGGFGKLKTTMDEVRSDYPDSFVLDGGDFSMGTPYQTIFSKEASELKMMKFLGYEATTFGNHEFDYRAKGLASMLQSAAGKGPQLLCANIDWEKTLKDRLLKDDAKVLKEACDAYGVKDYTVLDHDGVKMAVFGLLGESAVEYAPESGLIFKDAQQTAKDVVNEIKDKEDVDLIVCISHCGTIENEADKLEESEDYQLAENVPDIDLIVSGHSHTTLDEPVQVGDTYLVSCGSYNTNMGHVVLKKAGNRYKIKDYELVPLDESVKGDPLVEAELSKYRNLVNEEYFSQYGYSVSDEIVENQIAFPESSKIGLTQGEEPLGNLLADSYKYAIMQAEKGSVNGYEAGGVASGEVTSDQGGVQVTIVPLGVIRGSFLQGSVTVADAFNILSLGYGKDGQKLAMGDCAINIAPNEDELVEIAVETAKTAKVFGIDPKVAMLSYSTYGSGKGDMVTLVANATKKIKEAAPDLAVDGELQFDAAVAPEVAKVKCAGSPVAGQANTFIFPDINAGNIGYKIAARLGGYEAIGPVLQGLNAPINDLSRGCNAEEVYKMALVTAALS